MKFDGDPVLAIGMRVDSEPEEEIESSLNMADLLDGAPALSAAESRALDSEIHGAALNEAIFGAEEEGPLREVLVTRDGRLLDPLPVATVKSSDGFITASMARKRSLLGKAVAFASGGNRLDESQGELLVEACGELLQAFDNAVLATV